MRIWEVGDRHLDRKHAWCIYDWTQPLILRGPLPWDGLCILPWGPILLVFHSGLKINRTLTHINTNQICKGRHFLFIATFSLGGEHFIARLNTSNVMSCSSLGSQAIRSRPDLVCSKSKSLVEGCWRDIHPSFMEERLNSCRNKQITSKCPIYIYTYIYNNII